MTMTEVSTLIRESVQLGVMQAIKTYEPTKDKVRASEIKSWLELNGVDYGVFKKLESAGLIKGERLGDGRNSPIVYSKADVKAAISTHSVCKMIAYGKIEEV